MSNKELTFKEYINRLKTEAIIKSIICALIIGFLFAFLSATITWFTVFNGLYLSIILFFITSISSGFLLYSFKFKPNIKEVAKRLDALGFEERYITMLEFDGDDSLIPNLQRKDAIVKLESIKSRTIKFKLKKSYLVVLSIISVLGILMTTITGLSNAKALPTGQEFIDLFKEDEYFTVSYVIEDPLTGEIIGEAEQVVLKGESTTEVSVLPNDGYGFAYWSDNFSDNPNRVDENISENMTIVALLGKVDDNGGSSQQQQSGGEGDAPPKIPNDGQEGDEGQGGRGDDPSKGAGGSYSTESDTIIDGVYYYDNIDEYYLYAMQLLKEGKELPDYLKKIVENYFDTIR